MIIRRMTCYRHNINIHLIDVDLIQSFLDLQMFFQNLVVMVGELACVT